MSRIVTRPVTRIVTTSAAMAVTAASLLVAPVGPASAAVDSDVFTWGSNSFGQLGDGSPLSTMRGTPGQVSVSDVIEVSGGREHVIALKDDGTVITWGSDANGALGNGATQGNKSTPATVPDLTGVTDVDDGHYHSLAMKSDGTVWGWGQNHLGQLAQGNEASPITSPVQWGDIDNAVGVYGGRDMTYVLDDNGTLWCSGGRGLECGRALQANEITNPVTVNGLPDIVEVAGGRNHGVALATDGTVWTWGENDAAQLGDGTRTSRPTPEQVDGLTGIVDVGAGADHSMAVTASGEVYAWGENGRGELGLGDTTDRLSPAAVPALSGIVDVDAGRSHSFAITGDGRLWTWGWNDGRQVNSTGSNVLNPYLVPGLTDVAIAGGGQAYTVVLTNPVDALLSDGFDNGLANWTVTGKLRVDTVRSSPVGDAPSLRAAVTARKAAGVRPLPAPSDAACVEAWVRPVSAGQATTVLRLRDSLGAGIAQVQISPSGEVLARSDTGAVTESTGTSLAFGQWTRLRLCSFYGEAAPGEVSVSIGGVEAGSWNWSTAPIGQIQIGSLKKTTTVYNLDDLTVTTL